MSRIYDNWEKLVGAVLRREKDRQVARFPSFSSSSSAAVSSRSSFDFAVDTDFNLRFSLGSAVDADFSSRFSFTAFVGDVHVPAAVKPGSGIAVAVKKLNIEEGTQRHKDWVHEINYLGQLCHPNLIKLIGYSLDTGNRILVYEFMARGSLENHLFTRDHVLLPWATRMKVVVGAATARALAYLHEWKHQSYMEMLTAPKLFWTVS